MKDTILKLILLIYLKHLLFIIIYIILWSIHFTGHFKNLFLGFDSQIMMLGKYLGLIAQGSCSMVPEGYCSAEIELPTCLQSIICII